MTGQVKEDLLCRFGELGVRVTDGCIHFDRALMNGEEFLKAPATFEYVDVQQQWQTLALPAESLAYTLCQIPVVHLKGDTPGIEVKRADGSTQKVAGLSLDLDTSRAMFRRAHEVVQLTVVA